MKLFGLIFFLGIGQMANSQYTYFNNLYEYQDSTFSLNYKVFESQIGNYLSVGQSVDVVNNNYIVGSVFRSVNSEGLQTQRSISPLPIIFPAGGGIPNESVITLSDGSLVQFHITSNGWQGYAPLLIRFNNEFDTLWTRRIMIEATPPNSEGHANEMVGCGFTEISERSFMMLTFNRWGWSAQPDSLKLRYITFDYDGNILEEHATPMPEDLAPNGLRKLSDEHLLVWGTLYENNDRQVFVWKTDMQGNVLDSLVVGNTAEPEGDFAGLLVDGDKIILSYMKCLEHINSINNLFELHVLKLNSSDFEILQDATFDLLNYEVPGGGSSSMKIIKCMDGGFLVAHQHYLSNSQLPQNGLIRLDENIEEVWQSPYTAGYNFYSEYLNDVITTTDGGFAATGTTEVIYDDFSLMQKNWILKIDACGYEQPSGCPAVIGVDDPYPSEFDFQLWPNPCHNLLKARLPLDASLVRILDQTGRVVMEEKVFYPNQQWDVSRLCKGIYMIQVINEAGDSRTVKMVKE